MARRHEPLFVDLVLDNGEFIRIECPGQHEEDFLESIENAIKLGAEWSPRRFDNCHASYRGIWLERVNMARVIGRAG